MNPQDRDLLQKTYDLAKENNHILHGIRRSNRLSSVVRVLYWTVIIGASLGAYYYIQPYLDTVLNAYGQIQGDINSVKNVASKIPGIGQ